MSNLTCTVEVKKYETIITENYNLKEEVRRLVVSSIEKDTKIKLLKDRVKRLADSLTELHDVAGTCDGWDSFPAIPLDRAYDAIMNR